MTHPSNTPRRLPTDLGVRRDPDWRVPHHHACCPPGPWVEQLRWDREPQEKGKQMAQKLTEQNAKCSEAMVGCEGGGALVTPRKGSIGERGSGLPRGKEKRTKEEKKRRKKKEEK